MRNELGQFIKGRRVKLSEKTKRKIRMAAIGRVVSKATRLKISRSVSLVVRGDKNPNWRGGKSFEKYPKEWNHKLKESIRKRDNYSCQICGFLQSKLTGFFKKLEVHHIDKNKQNSSLSNLITLCGKCHRQADLKSSGHIGLHA